MSKWVKTILFLAGSAILTRFIPFASFFRNLDTMVHEFGHAMATLLLSGNVLRIDLNPDHSGVTYSMMPSSSTWGIAAVSMAGYVTAALVSVLLFYLYHKRYLKTGLLFITAVALASVIFFVHEGFGLWWLLGLISLNAVVLYAGTRPGKWDQYGKLLLKGYYLLLAFLTLEEAALSPLVLVVYSVTDPAAAGDAANLAKSTSVPALVWSLLFTVFSLYCAKLSLGWFVKGRQPRSHDGGMQ
ncbi:M50 family metallopeptidase [Paenibacillus sp. GCM10012307]|uniref:M50 family metallopeptidase n=1 Tax=Paenibacillus roseus TaxID=2798579 RepID=A0A934J4I6_9BACL|nr:M50 family metallopeptidase [Paenibacillus roseus]MBJ6360681.1 M50 family metallopeptidase [Paenibacillus roseus]